MCCSNFRRVFGVGGVKTMTSSRIILLLDQLRVCKGCLNRERSFDMPLNLTNNCNTKVVAMVRVIVDNPKQLLKKFADCWFTSPQFFFKISLKLFHCADVCPLRGTASIDDYRRRRSCRLRCRTQFTRTEQKI